MKWRSVVIAGLLLVGFATGALAASGGSFTLSWFSIDGGGGTAQGGSYALSGSVGQPDAGMLSGGSYTLAGGFWGGSTMSYVVSLPLIQ